MRQTRLIAAAITIVTLVAVAAPPAAADERDRPDRALLIFDGQPISVEAAVDLSCHDFAAPVIYCFAKPDEMLVDMERARATSDGAEAAALSGYVIAYEHTLYGGAARTMSVDYDDLRDIGWNDRISSFKSFGASGGFREHSPPSGFNYTFGTSSQVSNVGSAYNDKFSSLQLD